MESYDRLFPNQDTLPKGGLGNLIALPLQRAPRRLGNSVFVDESLEPLADQWTFIARIRPIEPSLVHALADEAARRGRVIGVRPSDMHDEDERTPWNLSPSRRARKAPITEPLPYAVSAVLCQSLFIEKVGLPPSLIDQLKRLAAFQNPEFYRKQSMRLPTALTPRVIACAEDLADHVALPRGCLPDAEGLLRDLGVEPGSIGRVGAGKRNPNGRLDVSMLQSLIRKGEVSDLVAGYGHVICDEAHHCPCVSFERVLAEVKARYVVGLTATPQRRDGHHPITQMQIGPVRFFVDTKSKAARRPFGHRLIVRQTDCKPAGLPDGAGIQEIYAALAADPRRNNLILNDVIGALEEKRSPILLTERRDHLDLFAGKLRGFTKNLVVLHGGMKPGERRKVLERIAAIPDGEEPPGLHEVQYETVYEPEEEAQYILDDMDE